MEALVAKSAPWHRPSHHRSPTATAADNPSSCRRDPLAPGANRAEQQSRLRPSAPSPPPSSGWNSEPEARSDRLVAVHNPAEHFVPLGLDTALLFLLRSRIRSHEFLGARRGRLRAEAG